jgi:hypothetical protein
VVHGFLLEGMALALEGCFEPFSQGRGFITPERVAEVDNIAARHGIYLAPLYNADGPLEGSTSWRGGMLERMSVARENLDAQPMPSTASQVPLRRDAR